MSYDSHLRFKKTHHLMLEMVWNAVEDPGDPSDAFNSTGQASRLLPEPQDRCRRDAREHGIGTAEVASGSMLQGACCHTVILRHK